MSATLKAEHVRTRVEFQDWCRRLHREGPHPCDPMRRFAIGVYQIHQAIDWVGTESEYESYAAAAIHFTAAAESFEIPIEQGVFAAGLVATIPFGVGGVRSLLYNLSKSQVQLVYATNSSRFKRKSRFNKVTAVDTFSFLVRDLISMIPPHKRESAIYKAMEIMTGEL